MQKWSSVNSDRSTTEWNGKEHMWFDSTKVLKVVYSLWHELDFFSSLSFSLLRRSIWIFLAWKGCFCCCYFLVLGEIFWLLVGFLFVLVVWGFLVFLFGGFGFFLFWVLLEGEGFGYKILVSKKFLDHESWTPSLMVGKGHSKGHYI